MWPTGAETASNARGEKFTDSLYKPSRTAWRFSNVYVDLVGPISSLITQTRVIFSVTDRSTRWVEALKNMKAATCKDAFLNVGSTFWRAGHCNHRPRGPIHILHVNTSGATIPLLVGT